MDPPRSVRDAMTRDYVGVSEADPLPDVVELMDEEESGSAVVLRGSRPVGILTERDVLEYVANGVDPEVSTTDVMSSPVQTIDAQQSVTEAIRILAREEIRRLPVLDDDALVGILTARDVLAVAARTEPEVVEGVTDGPTAEAVGMPTEGATAGATSPTAGGGEIPEGGTAGAERTAERADQAICERCGRLTRDLVTVEGAVVCPDCRSV